MLQPKGSDDLLEYFEVRRYCSLALSAPHQDYNSDVAGDRSLYRGDGKWSLSILSDWPPTSYNYVDIPPEHIKDILRLQPGPGRPLDKEFQGERVLTAPAFQDQRGDKKKKSKKEKKEKKSKKEKKEKEDRKRKRDDTSFTEITE